MKKSKKARSVVTERGQVTIPKSLRDSVGIMPGSVLIFELQNNSIVVSKDKSRDPIATVYGCLKGNTPYKNTDTYINEIRRGSDAR